MSETQPLDITVVYTSRSRRRGSRARIRGSSTMHRIGVLAVIGWLNIMLAGVGYYYSWWRADPDLKIKMLLFTQLPGVNTELVANEIIPQSATKPLSGRQSITPGTTQQAKNASGPVPSGGSSNTGDSKDASMLSHYSSYILPGTVLGWEILVTLALCAMMLAGGSMIARSSIGFWRNTVLIFGLIGLLGFGYMLNGLWSKYHRLTPDFLRYFVGVIIVVVMLIGLVFRTRVKGLTYVASVALIVSGVATAIGLYIGAQHGAVAPEYATPRFLATAFGVHSLWGWILLPVAWRYRR